MTVFGLVESSGLKEIASYQVSQWDFGNFFVLFWLQKMIVVDADGIFYGVFKKPFQDTLLVLVHAVARCEHKSIRNEVFYNYFNNLHKTNSADKGSLHQWFQGVFFTVCL